jgi:hypothetical protein
MMARISKPVNGAGTVIGYHLLHCARGREKRNMAPTHHLLHFVLHQIAKRKRPSKEIEDLVLVIKTQLRVMLHPKAVDQIIIR